ncbi:MAG: hypothetical protein A2252_02650 [Elusimicrobia bacterium RIFOXYA2_FULL_39_19]|nr:MAG: hypothetical protein A2252_02650 [Elusimicrobia bacterium RIFOXYA2_FULL_39_19]
MKHKDKKNQHKQQAHHQQAPVIQVKPVTGISGRGKKVIFSGILLLLLGFFVLSKTDSYGQNWAGVISPFMIIAAYIIIGIGIIFPDSKAQANQNTSQSK